MLAARFFNSFLLIILLGISTLVAGAEAPNFTSIKHYGQLASAAYAGKSKAHEVCEKQGYQLTHFGTASGVEVGYFLATDDARKTQVIAVRGTANVENVMVDVDFKLMLDEHTSNMLHTGFAQSSAAIYKIIKPMLKRGYTISTTGHSLGGAVAMVLAMYLDQDEYKLGQVITFGQPKVTNITGAKRYDYMKITRVVNEKDVVPLVPPFDPTDMKNMDLFWHAGQELILLPGNEYSLASGIPSMLRTVKFFKETPGEENIQNHLMTLYLERLDKIISNGKQVPLKTGFTLYDMF